MASLGFDGLLRCSSYKFRRGRCFPACKGGSRNRMGTLRLWPWQVVLLGVSLIVLLVATHFFVTPLFPTFYVDSSALVFQRINDTHGWNPKPALECDMKHGAVVYRNATWKTQVGCWLSQCDNSAVLIPVVEVSGGIFSLLLPFLNPKPSIGLKFCTI